MCISNVRRWVGNRPAATNNVDSVSMVLFSVRLASLISLLSHTIASFVEHYNRLCKVRAELKSWFSILCFMFRSNFVPYKISFARSLSVHCLPVFLSCCTMLPVKRVPLATPSGKPTVGAVPAKGLPKPAFALPSLKAALTPQAAATPSLTTTTTERRVRGGAHSPYAFIEKQPLLSPPCVRLTRHASQLRGRGRPVQRRRGADRVRPGA